MNVSIDMLKNKKAKVNDRLYDNEMDYLGLITELNEVSITLKTGIHYNTFDLVDLYLL